MQSPYQQPFQPFRPYTNGAASPLPPLVSPSALKRGQGDYFQDYRNVSSPRSSTFQSNSGYPRSPMSYDNGPRSPNPYRFGSSSVTSPYQENFNQYQFQPPTRRRRQSLPELNSFGSGSYFSEDPMYYDSLSPSYSWNDGVGNGSRSRNRGRSATVTFSPNTTTIPSRNQNQMMSPSDYSDTLLPASYPSPYQRSRSPNPMLFSPNYYDDYGPPTIQRPLRSSVQFQQTFELHTYLSIPPFNYSVLTRPEIIARQGFNGLHQYATRPPTSVMVLQSPHLPWKITVGSTSTYDKYLTVSEVLNAIYQTLRESPTTAEINILYSSSEDKKKYNEVIDAYQIRCARENPYNQDVMRKLDWLAGKTVFNGLVSRKNSGGGGGGSSSSSIGFGKKKKDKPTWTILFRSADFH